MLQLAPIKPKIAGALKTQLSNVALHKHSVVRTTYGKLHAVAALYLKGHIIGRERMRHRIVCIKQFQNGSGEFPIVKDTTPNMMNQRLYTTSYNKPQGQQFDDTAVLSFIKLQYT